MQIYPGLRVGIVARQLMGYVLRWDRGGVVVVVVVGFGFDRGGFVRR